ncbi:DUF885 domain-containing protein [Sphingomonas nostoxanthinifaciens]|uniref:DUF885 domain-containing protein n=1 Tax=Sphingomonas nostoxanthinifaciens TaxID=2872652 RepID=UPI001CC20A7B|nr:DUF885 domain-containing protein [Sphingomonas nostoxanthinifaciens]UAK23487.1 DUF885 domain-containing protein [Sphingomonas nostoxanthinifaciens]
MRRMFDLGLIAAVAIAVAPASAEPIAPVLAAYQTVLDEERDDLPGRWPDLSPAAVKARNDRLTAVARRLDAPAPANEGGEDRITRDILGWRLHARLEEARFDTERMPFIGGDGFYTTPIYVASTTVLHDEAEAKAWIAKIGALPAYYDQAIVNMKRGLATGFVQPKIVVDATLAQLRTAAGQAVADNALLKPFAKRPPAVDASRWEALKAEATQAVASRVKPAEARAVAFMADDYLPHARAGLGAGSMPGGQDYYAHLVRVSTTTDMTPQQVFDLGQSEVARIGAEMEAAKHAAGFDGSMHDFLVMLRSDKRFYATDVDDYVARVSAVVKRVDEYLPRYFGTLPRLTFTIKLKPPELDGTSGGYFLGDPAKGVAGAVMLSKSSATDPLFSMPSWILHEGVPGHHLQIALAQERTDLPPFRRKDDVTAFVEGWALYTERLGDEMGMYRTPYEQVGRLSYEMWRACRLVMDVGIHAKGWSFDQAAACLREHTALPERVVTGETLRYVGWPAQALAYKVGEVRIRAMRARAEVALGPKFDIRAFHDALLDDGPMPMAILDRQIDGWIAARR